MMHYGSAETLTEPIAIEDIYVSRLLGIEDAGDGNIRFVFGSGQRSSYDEHSMESVVRVRLVTGPTLIMHTIKEALRYMGHSCCGAVKRRLN